MRKHQKHARELSEIFKRVKSWQSGKDCELVLCDQNTCYKQLEEGFTLAHDVGGFHPWLLGQSIMAGQACPGTGSSPPCEQ
jgi:hypothetical protein